MASPYTQDTRRGDFHTPLGKDKLVLRRFDGTEGLSELFEYRIEAIATEDLDFDKAIGKNCTLTMRTIDGGERHFDGILTEVQLIGVSTEGAVYRLILRPWLWLLSRTSNLLIFNEKTLPAIISAIFAKHPGIAKAELKLARQYPELEYTVQYRESDMAFVCRLLEQHGIYYYFRHSKGEHVMVIGDHSAAFHTIEGEKRPYISIEAHHRRDTEHFFQWTPERRFTSGKIALMDYNFKTVGANMGAMAQGDAKYEHGGLELYDYPGKYPEQDKGNKYAGWRIEMERAGDGRFIAAGDCVSCAPGDLVTLTGHPDSKQNARYLALRSIHTFAGETYRSTGADDRNYQGNYEFMLASKPFAPPVVTEKPYVHGPHTAVVVGDGEIHTDKYGRIRVRFHWDRMGDQSMWVRVAQIWASQNWGGIFIPRVGMEVIVNFLEGDPDQPIVVGCVYNSRNMPPYDLPGSMNMAGWKSHSTPGKDGYNEIMMDDSAGNELLRVHAQYDMKTKVEHDEFRHVGKNRDTKVDVDEEGYVGNNRVVYVKVNDTLDVGKELMIKAGVKITLMVGKSTLVMDGKSVTVTSDMVDVKASQLFQSKSDLLSTHSATVQMDIKGGIVAINS